MKRHHKNRTRRKRHGRYSYETLEPRRVLATTLYVDFGVGLGGADITMTDAFAATVGAPQVFGGGTQLRSFNNAVLTEGFDFSGDGAVDLADTAYLQRWVISQMERTFAPFDIQIVEASAAHRGEIRDMLLSNPGQSDAYVYVTGADTTLAAEPGDTGVAIVDLGNSEDNLAFVFAEPMFDNWFSGPFGSEPPHFLAWNIARSIAKQASHTLGLVSVEGSVLESRVDVMALPGTRPDGSIRSDQRSESGPVVFSQAELPLRLDMSDTSAGTQNSFEVMAANVGLRPGGPTFVTTDGDADLIEVVSTGANSVMVTIDGGTPQTLDIANGLVIATGRQGDDRTRMGTHLVVDQNVAQSVEFQAGQYGHFEVVGAGTEIVIDGILAGRAGMNMTFSGVQFVTATDGHDTITRLPGGHILGIDGGGGNDQITLREDPGKGAFSNAYYVKAGAGHDTITLHHLNQQMSVDGGPGPDTLVDMRSDVSRAELEMFSDNGTPGFSARMTSRVTTPGGLLFGQKNGLVDLEAIVNDSGQSRTLTRISRAFPDSQTTVLGDLAEVRNVTGDLLGTFRGFNELLHAATLTLRQTAYPIAVEGDHVIISSTEDPELSDLMTLQHPVSATSWKKLQVFKRAGDPVIGKVRFDGQVVGMANNRLDTFGILEFHLTEGADYFVVEDSGYHHPAFRGVSVFGYGGDDVASFGSSMNKGNGNLSDMHGLNHFDGGAGQDQMVLNDQGRKVAGGYRIDANGINNLDVTDTIAYGLFDVARSGRRLHEIPVFTFDSEIVRLTGTEFADTFVVDPLDHVRLIVDGAGGLDRLVLNRMDEALFFTLQGPWEGVYTFPNEEVYYKRIENKANVDRLAVAAGPHPASEPLVKVYDVASNQHLFDVLAYGPGFRGGVNVATGNFSFDGIPDIVTAPAGDHSPRVRVLNGIDGSFVAAFDAYHEAYRGGVLVATGEVFANNETREIVTVNMRGNPLVRVFVQHVNTFSFDLVRQFRPYPMDVSLRDGLSITLMDTTGDGRDEIVLGVRENGFAPEVRIYDPRPVDTPLLRSFLVTDPNTLRGLSLSSGRFVGDASTDLAISIGGLSAAHPLAGRALILDLDQTENGAGILPPSATVTMFGDGASLSLATGQTQLPTGDRLFAAQRMVDGEVIREADLMTLGAIDRFFETDPIFDGGIQLG